MNPLIPGPDSKRTEPVQAALLVDWESLRHALSEMRMRADIHALAQKVRLESELMVARAYGDYRRSALSADTHGLQSAGVEPISLPGATGQPASKGANRRSGASVRMALDCAELCLNRPSVERYYIASTEGDVIHIINFLKLHGRKANLVSVSWAITPQLVRSADCISLYDMDFADIREIGENPGSCESSVSPSEPTAKLSAHVEPVPTAEAQSSQYILDQLGDEIIRYMDHLENASEYITYGYLMEKLKRESWMPLPDEQLSGMINFHINSETLLRSTYRRDEPGRYFSNLPVLSLNRSHSRVISTLSSEDSSDESAKNSSTAPDT